MSWCGSGACDAVEEGFAGGTGNFAIGLMDCRERWACAFGEIRVIHSCEQDVIGNGDLGLIEDVEHHQGDPVA